MLSTSRVYKPDDLIKFHFINSGCEKTLCLDVEDAEPQPQVDIATYANQCGKTYAKCVDDAFMMEFELQKDFFAETAAKNYRILSHYNSYWSRIFLRTDL